MDVDLKDLNRDDLNQFAEDHFAAVIDDPAAYGTKDQLREAVEAAQAGEPVPAPEKAKSGGTSVTFTGKDEDEGCRSVRVGDEQFRLGVEVEHVDDETVEVLKAMEGCNFDFS